MSGETVTADLLFWVLLALMAGGAVALLLGARDWLSSDESEEEPERGRGGHDLAVYSDQLHELEADLARGVLTEAEATPVRLEIERRVLAADRELDQAPQVAAFSPGLRRRSLVALMVVIPVAALGLYLFLGVPGLPGQPFDSRSAPGQEVEAPDMSPGDISEADISAMVEGLAARLEQEPENLEGWRMLAQSYLVLERPDEAYGALRKGLEHFPNDPGLLLALARIEVFLAQEEDAETDMTLGEAVPLVPPKAARFYERLLAVMPEHEEALWMVGLAEAQSGNRDKARKLWLRLLALTPRESESRAALEEYLRILEK
ncbi:MAG: c-type cytochrome biogenesis protein CcmI [Alphaproteobacteria bacterium]|nr:c-type cytochrome biogenesis protein CcmI [Alphaproteobacteria bacterium]